MQGGIRLGMGDPQNDTVMMRAMPDIRGGLRSDRGSNPNSLE